MTSSSSGCSGTPIEQTLQALREAIKLSPDNSPLRLLLAGTLMSHGHFAEAEREYRHLLCQSPDDIEMKLNLAGAFLQQAKHSQALVLVEDVISSASNPARAYLLQARIFFTTGNAAAAVTAYHDALEADPSVADEELRTRLGIPATPDTSEVVEGRIADTLQDALPQPIESGIERPRLGFQDVGGMESLKEEIRLKIIHPLTHAHLYQAYGKKTGGGILMYGPPGCGKTLMARATAGEIKAGFIAVGINEVLEMWVGQSERNLHAMFEQARDHRPCVLFFDEVDALGASRTDMRQSAGRQMINQFLSELDGVSGDNDGVLILAATNAPWHLDSAFRRPGRFDRILFVPPPDPAARSAILRVLCQDKPAHNLDFEYLAKKTPEFSGADLKGMVDLAVEYKLREAMKTGIPGPLSTNDLLTAAAATKSTTKEWFATARNYAIYSNQGGIYDDILRYLKL